MSMDRMQFTCVKEIKCISWKKNLYSPSVFASFDNISLFKKSKRFIFKEAIIFHRVKHPVRAGAQALTDSCIMHKKINQSQSIIFPPQIKMKDSGLVNSLTHYTLCKSLCSRSNAATSRSKGKDVLTIHLARDCVAAVDFTQMFLKYADHTFCRQTYAFNTHKCIVHALLYLSVLVCYTERTILLKKYLKIG